MSAVDEIPATAVPSRRLKILFVVECGTVLRFALLLSCLAERGHELHIAFSPGRDWVAKPGTGQEPIPLRTRRLLDELCARFPRITYGRTPVASDSDGWRTLAWIVRGLEDLAHNAGPQHADADVIRARTNQRILGGLRRADFNPVIRRLALSLAKPLASRTDERLSRRVLDLALRLEEAIPPSKEVDNYLLESSPDLVLATGTFRHMSSEVELLKSARGLGIPAGTFVASWDNLTNKGALKFTPERIFVWNEAQVNEAVELHGMPRERVQVTGAHAFDEWFGREPSRSRNDFLELLGLDPAEPYLAYLCSSGNIVHGGEVEFVRRWLAALRSSGDQRLRRMGVVVRPHPNENLEWEGAELGFDNAVVWPAKGKHPVAEETRADFFDTLAYSAAVVGINTTAMIEAAIVGKSVLTVLVPEFGQERTLHFHYLLAENGGFLHVADSLEEHLDQLRRVLDEDSAGTERRRRFVEAFVRPCGVDEPAASVAADAVEALAARPVQRNRPGARALELALAPLAAIARVQPAARRRGTSAPVRQPSSPTASAGDRGT